MEQLDEVFGWQVDHPRRLHEDEGDGFYLEDYSYPLGGS